MERFSDIEFIGEGLAKAYVMKKNRYYLVDLEHEIVSSTPYISIGNVYGGTFIASKEKGVDLLLNKNEEELFRAPKIYANDGKRCVFLQDDGRLGMGRPTFGQRAVKEFDKKYKFEGVTENGLVCLSKRIRAGRKMKYPSDYTKDTFFIDKNTKLVIGQREVRHAASYFGDQKHTRLNYILNQEVCEDAKAKEIMKNAEGYNRKIDTSFKKELEKNREEFLLLKSQLDQAELEK